MGMHFRWSAIESILSSNWARFFAASNDAGDACERDRRGDGNQTRSRNGDKTVIKEILGWEPDTPLREGLAKTYTWIEQQYMERKAGKRTVS